MTDTAQGTDGGPAFPPFHDPRTHEQGMSLRDWFAGQAMAAMLTGVVGKIGAASDVHAYATGPCNAVIVDRAYTIADAMLTIIPAIQAGERERHDAEILRYRRGIIMAMGCLDIFKGGDEALAWYRLYDAMSGKEPRVAIRAMSERADAQPVQSGQSANVP
jgi:hypothetical protein